MGARSELHIVHQPWPVVYDALIQCLPTRGFRITGVDRERGRIDAETRNTRFTVAVGAVDAVTTEWISTAELKVGILRDRHERHFAAMRDALATYVATYYS